MKMTVEKIVFAAAVVFLTITCTPTETNKNAGGLRLSAPVETPTAVHFTWTGGAVGAVYSIYRRRRGEENWERIKMGLVGVSGLAVAQGFTLDSDYDYKIQAEEQ